MSNPFLDRIEKRKIGHAGRKAEKRGLKSLRAKPLPASGAKRGAKSDGVRQGFRFELKSTTVKAIKLEREWLEKIRGQQLPADSLAYDLVRRWGREACHESESRLGGDSQTSI